MFDISWSELLILGVVTLIFVGPKELPRFLGTLGRYAGVVRRQAAEFRRIFDEAIREAELDEIKKNVTELREDVTSPFRDAERQLSKGVSSAAPASSDQAKAAAEAPPLAAPKSIGQPAPAGEPARDEGAAPAPERGGEGH